MPTLRVVGQKSGWEGEQQGPICAYMRRYSSIYAIQVVLTRNRPFKVSRLCLSTALCVALRSAVLARLEVLRFSTTLAGVDLFVVEAFWLSELVVELPVCGGYGSTGVSGVGGGSETGEPSGEVLAFVVAGNIKEIAIGDRRL